MIRRCQPLCGTFFEIEISSLKHDENILLDWSREAFTLGAQIEKDFSPFDETSELSRFNNAEQLVSSDLFKEALVKTELLVKESDGLFNPYKDGKLNINGFVKGWTVDLMLDLLRSKDCDYIMINGGGDLRFWVDPKNTQHRASPEIFIRDLEDPNKISKIVLHEPCAVATSANYPYDYEHAKNHNIEFVDKTTKPVQFFTTTVIAPECWQADSLTKVLVQNLNVAQAMAQKWNAKFYFKSQKEELCYDPSKT